MAPRKSTAKKRKTEETEEGQRDGDDSGAPGDLTADKMPERKEETRRGKLGNKKYIGAHVGIQGGIWKAVESCTEMGGRSFALFLGSQRSWKRPALDPKAAAKFQEQCSLQGLDPAHILPHGSYLMNCGSPKEDVYEKSQALLVDELSRCSALGLHLYNFHPGSSLGSISTQQCIERIAGAINYAHQQVPAVVTVLENMSGQGNTVGGDFSELKAIIDQVRDRSRVGVCLDTCHAFAAGYDVAADGGVKALLEEFDKTVGLKYLTAVHLNDSKGKLGCHLDRHEDIGKGQIGLSAFQDIVNEPILDGIPLILETPGRPGFEYAEQIQLLYSLCKSQ
ncbi:probable endonuclease 4 [Lampris incognitus]|uniref:probable endonuclease 4 n=1 Tax=Lampris incognitus TaxID=2546036 RepID=UPI0024B52CC4|nr:probable endonuclease 4 [Lampris incognitus]XP_056153247.1 probable endonuclease 4 [Lampris incognitus]